MVYTYIGYNFSFLSCFSWLSSCSSADLDLKGKGYGFGFVFGDDWVHIKDCLGFMWVVANFQVGLGRVGVVSSSRQRCQELFTSAFWLNLGCGCFLSWIKVRFGSRVSGRYLYSV